MRRHADIHMAHLKSKVSPERREQKLRVDWGGGGGQSGSGEMGDGH